MIKSYLISMVLSFFMITILNIFLKKNNERLHKKILWQHYFFGYLFLLYLMIALKDVVGFPTLSQWQMRFKYDGTIFNPNINLIPFRGGIRISDILNIIFFMPFGFLLPTLWKRYKGILPTLFYGLIFSGIIEFAQLFTNGRGTDINDLIMNTLGTICGWIVFKFISKIFHKLANSTVIKSTSNDNIIIRLEPYLYVGIAIIGTFLS